MSILAQQGYGKSDKINVGLAEGHISGVVLSPRDESPNNLENFVDALRNEFGDAAMILFDPQFYVSTIAHARDRFLPEYPYYNAALTRADFISQANINTYAAQVLSYQVGLSLDRLISPTVLVSDLNDIWSQITLSLASESLAIHSSMDGPPPLLLALAFDEPALSNREALNEFLDIISVLEPQGFYTILRSNTVRYPLHLEQLTIENLLYLVYVLAEINGFEVVCGYTDIMGILMHAVGASATSTGWHNSLRSFSLKRFQPQTGGRAARDRYTSTPLLSSLLVVPELEIIYQVGLIQDVLSGTNYDGPMAASNPSNIDWPLRTACLHNWQALSQISQHIVGIESVSDRITEVESMLETALATYHTLQDAGVMFDAASGPGHLSVWLEAIRNFRTDLGV